MYNSKTPSTSELPSSQQLLRSTIVAALVALALLVTVVLPAEYGKDVTGIGRLLGLTEMGQIKVQLALEAEADTADTPAPAPAPALSATPPTAAPAEAAPQASPSAGAAEAPALPAQAASAWRDTLNFTLAPGQGIEIKLVMKEGERATFDWAVDGGVVNFDTHGDGSGRAISYEKGRGVAADQGELVAAFTGNHGWFWRNRGEQDVAVTLRTGGQYSAIKR